MFELKLFCIWTLGFTASVWTVLVNNNFYKNNLFRFTFIEKLLLIIFFNLVNISICSLIINSLKP